MVNGHGPYPFVFDTGSPALLVMQSLADELKLEVVDSDELVSPIGGTPLPVDVVKVESITLGGATTEDIEAFVLDMDGRGLGMGIVGPALFRDHGAMTIDFQHNTIGIGGPPPEGIATWMPFGDSAPLLDVPVRIGDTVVKGHLDTGSPGRVTLPYDFEDKLPLTGPGRTIGRGRTVDAEFEVRSAPIDAAASLGDAKIPLEQIEFSNNPAANVGTAAVRGLMLHIDWAEDRFALTGTAKPLSSLRQRAHSGPAETGSQRVVQAAGGKQPTFGMRAVPSSDGTIQVVRTDPGTAAEAIGLQEGDRIVALNGKSAGDLDRASVRSELMHPDLVLTVERDGETVQLQRSPESES